MKRQAKHRVHGLKVCLTCSVLQLAVPNIAQAQTLNFLQSDGSVILREITQSGSGNHKIGGIDGGDTPAWFSGPFSSLIFQQTGSAASLLAMGVRVSNPSSLSFHMASAGELKAEVLAGQYLSTIITTDADEKNLDISVLAPDAAVSQDIALSGGPIDLWVTQTNDASLSLAYTGLGSAVAEVQVLQSGFDTVADVTGSGDSGSVLLLNLRGDTATAYVNTNLGINSRLTYELNNDGVSVGTALNPISVTVPDNSAITVTGDENVFTYDIEADSLTFEVTMSGDENILTTELAAPSVDLSVDIDGYLNTVTQTASATTSISLRHTIDGDSNTVEYNSQSDANIVNSASVVSSALTLIGDTNNITLSQGGGVGTISGSFTMSGRDVTITQTGASNSAYMTVGAVGNGTDGNVDDYSVTQSAAASMITDMVYLSAGASSSISVTN